MVNATDLRGCASCEHCKAMLTGAEIATMCDEALWHMASSDWNVLRPST